MTPQEIFEYKMKWKPGYAVRLHSDLRNVGKDYCKAKMFKEQWDMSTYTDNYEDTYYFQHKEDADKFATQWPEYINQ